jgi:hypothetical protein
MLAHLFYTNPDWIETLVRITLGVIFFAGRDLLRARGAKIVGLVRRHGIEVYDAHDASVPRAGGDHCAGLRRTIVGSRSV